MSVEILYLEFPLDMIVTDVSIISQRLSLETEITQSQEVSSNITESISILSIIEVE